MAEFKLTLVQRKNIKEQEETLQSNLQIIKDATGKDEFTLEVDWGTVYPVMALADRPGDTIYSSVLGGLAGNIKRLCENEFAKEAFNEATSANKVIITIDKKASSYWSEKFNNGAVEIGFKGGACNVSEIGKKLEEQLTCTFEDVQMPIPLRKNITENEEKKQEHLERLQKATGRDFTLTVQWGDMIKDHMGTNPSSFASTLYSSCLGGLVDNIVRLCDTEVGKEAFNAFATTGNIIFNSNKNDKKAPSYYAEAFINGDLVISYKSICNCSSIGAKIEEQLTSTFEEAVMPLLLHKNILNTEEKKQEHFERLQKATGRDFTLTIQWPEMIKDHMGTNPSSFGSTLYSSCLGGLVDNIVKVCDTEVGKDAFNEFASTGNIIFNSNKNAKNAPSYYAEAFINGDLVISFKSICNCSSIGAKIEEQLTTTFEETVMPLLLRKSILNNDEKREEHLEKLKEATGRDFTLTVQWPEMIKDHMGTNPSNFGATLYSSCLGGLVDNLVKLCNNQIYSGKDALNEFASTGNIIFNSNKNDKKAPSYYQFQFVNGDIVVGFKSICNVSDIGRDAEEYLTVSYEEQTVPYVLRRSLAENEEKLQENLEIINTATGKTFEVVVDWPKMLPFLKDVNKTQNHQVGSVLYNSVLSGLAGQLKKLCADELGQEGFNESCSTGKIVLSVEDDKKAPGYWTEKFVNGDLVIAFKSICNCSDIGKGIEKLL